MHLVYAVVVGQVQLYTDLTGRFPVRSSKGNWYVMICYSFDCNYVKAVPMKSRSVSEWLKAYGGIHQELTSRGFKPKLQTLDKEASSALKSFFTENDVEYQLVPPHCHMMMMYIKNYYLGTPFPRYEYMLMLLSRFPEEIVNKYNLKELAMDGWVYIEIRKGMYRLKQACLLANKILQKQLDPFVCYPAHHTPGLSLHKKRHISFSLIVDDFALEYMGKQHAYHSKNALLRSYELTTDWEGKIYSGMTFQWD
jgi:hypothetical protein